jgi:hypothetical protein
MGKTISFTLNGKLASVKVDDERMLLWVLRSDLGLTGTKFGCGEALCGACTVIVNKQAVRSCSTPVKDVAGKQVLTIEGLGQNGLHAIQQAEEVRFKDGAVLDRNFDSYAIPRFSWLPKIETILMGNPETPALGGGEPPIITMGAVLANAIYDATGVRMLQLPMTAERIVGALMLQNG